MALKERRQSRHKNVQFIFTSLPTFWELKATGFLKHIREHCKWSSIQKWLKGTREKSLKIFIVCLQKLQVIMKKPTHPTIPTKKFSQGQAKKSAFLKKLSKLTRQKERRLG